MPGRPPARTVKLAPIQALLQPPQHHLFLLLYHPLPPIQSSIPIDGRAPSPISFAPRQSSSSIESNASDCEEENNTLQSSEFFPSLNETFLGVDSSTEEDLPQDDRKFIIFESCLKELFQVCRKCFAPCKSVSRVSGTWLQIQTLCANHHFLTWSSQPMINGKAAGNVLMSAAMLFAGTSPTSALRMFNYVNVQVFTSRTFSNYQRGYLRSTRRRKVVHCKMKNC
ncbi:uncharacterized protein LOC144128085 isoform X1 [Amblyomma americanum]